MDECVVIPRKLFEKLSEIGVDVESRVVEVLLRELKLDPGDEVEIRLELAERFLAEGRALVDKDPVQAGEKLYKAAEECVKALAAHFNIEEIMSRVRERGGWTAAELERAVLVASDRLGVWFEEAWDRAWALHVWGFHEGKFDSGDVRRRLPYVERMVREVSRLIKR
ncbi:MAG: PaREP1 family protein [Sulfolobales archaeon]